MREWMKVVLGGVKIEMVDKGSWWELGEDGKWDGKGMKVVAEQADGKNTEEWTIRGVFGPMLTSGEIIFFF